MTQYLEDSSRKSIEEAIKILRHESPPPGTVVPPLAMLQPAQTMDIERMAGQGMNLEQIRVRLGLNAARWAYVVRCNPMLREAYEAGAARALDEISGAMRRGAAAGDMVAAKYWLDRFGGPQFKPPSSPAVVVNTNSPVQIDVGQDIDALFAKQTTLLDGVYEVVQDQAPTAVPDPATLPHSDAC